MRGTSRRPPPNSTSRRSASPSRPGSSNHPSRRANATFVTCWPSRRSSAGPTSWRTWSKCWSGRPARHGASSWWRPSRAPARPACSTSWRSHATQRDVLVLRGQGVDQAAPRPFQMLEGIADRHRRQRPRRGTGRRGWPPRSPRRSGGCGGGRAPGPGGRGRPGRPQRPRSRAVRRGEEHRGTPPAARRPRRGTPCRPRSSWTTAVGRRHDAQAARPLAGPPGGDADGRLVVVAAFRSEEVTAGHPLRSVDPHVGRRPAPLHRRRRRGALRVDGRTAAGRRRGPRWCGSPTAAPSWPQRCSAAWSRRVPCAPAARAGRSTPGPWRDVQTSRRAALILQRRFELLAPDTIELALHRGRAGQGVRPELGGRACRATTLAASARRSTARDGGGSCG